MAYTYHDYVALPETTAAEVAAKLARLRLHLQEVQANVALDISADGMSRSSQSLIDYRAQLIADESRLRNLQRALGSGTRLKAYLRRPR